MRGDKLAAGSWDAGKGLCALLAAGLCNRLDWLRQCRKWAPIRPKSLTDSSERTVATAPAHLLVTPFRNNTWFSPYPHCGGQAG